MKKMTRAINTNNKVILYNVYVFIHLNNVNIVKFKLNDVKKQMFDRRIVLIWA